MRNKWYFKPHLQVLQILVLHIQVSTCPMSISVHVVLYVVYVFIPSSVPQCPCTPKLLFPLYLLVGTKDQNGYDLSQMPYQDSAIWVNWSSGQYEYVESVSLGMKVQSKSSNQLFARDFVSKAELSVVQRRNVGVKDPTCQTNVKLNQPTWAARTLTDKHKHWHHGRSI